MVIYRHYDGVSVIQMKYTLKTWFSYIAKCVENLLQNKGWSLTVGRISKGKYRFIKYDCNWKLQLRMTIYIIVTNILQ